MQNQDINASGKVKVFLEDVLKIIDAEIADATLKGQSFANKEKWRDAILEQAIKLSMRRIRIKILEMKRR